MIPNKIDVLRKSYLVDMTELLTRIGNELKVVELPTERLMLWEHNVILDRRLTQNESFIIRQELSLAGWGSVVCYHNATVDLIRVYLPVH